MTVAQWLAQKSSVNLGGIETSEPHAGVSFQLSGATSSTGYKTAKASAPGIEGDPYAEVDFDFSLPSADVVRQDTEGTATGNLEGYPFAEASAGGDITRFTGTNNRNAPEERDISAALETSITVNQTGTRGPISARRGRLRSVQIHQQDNRRGLTPRPFTAEEHQLVMELRRKGASWVQIADALPHRTLQVLKAHFWRVRKTEMQAFTPEEDQLIVELREQKDMKWEDIAGPFPGQAWPDLSRRLAELMWTSKQNNHPTHPNLL